QLRVLTVLAKALKKAEKAEDAKAVQARIDKLEKQAKAAAEMNEAKLDEEDLKKGLPFKPEPYARKAKSDRVVLVELFTGAQCPPCVGADYAYDGLLKTYKPAEVVLLQYHIPANGPDPLTAPDGMARVKFYEDEIEGAPAFFSAGKAFDGGGGKAEDAEDLYKSYRKLIDPLLEKPAGVKLRVVAVQKGEKINIAAEVSELEKPGEQMKLRFALVEEQVRYAGGNGIRFHHNVVRSLPGGPDGFVLKEKAGRHLATVDLDKLRKELADFLDDKMKQIPADKRPMELKNLRVVAFVQNDRTKEVLHA